MATTLTIRFKGVMAGLRQTRKRYKASDYLRRHIARFNKSAPEMVKIDMKLNDFMMSRVVKQGNKVKVEISKTGEIINVKLAPGQVAISPNAPAQTSAVPAASKSSEKAKSKPQQEAKATEQKSSPKLKQEKPAKPEKQQEHKVQPVQPKPAAPTPAGQQ